MFTLAYEFIHFSIRALAYFRTFGDSDPRERGSGSRRGLDSLRRGFSAKLSTVRVGSELVPALVARKKRRLTALKRLPIPPGVLEFAEDSTVRPGGSCRVTSAPRTAFSRCPSRAASEVRRCEEERGLWSHKGTCNASSSPCGQREACKRGSPLT